MTRHKELQNDIASIRLGQLLVCALIRFPVQVLIFRSLYISTGVGNLFNAVCQFLNFVSCACRTIFDNIVTISSGAKL